MRCVVQRVGSAQVSVAGETIGRIDCGLLVLVAFAPGDGETELQWMSRKLVNLRLFNDDQGRINLSLQDVGGGILLISQFTLYGDCRKGNRPSFVGSAPLEMAEVLYDRFGEILEGMWDDVAQGRFGAAMEVSLVNSGPVTVIVDRDAPSRTGRIEP